MAKDSMSNTWGKQYVRRDTWQAQNVSETNSQLGFNNYSDRAINSKGTHGMQGAKRAMQPGVDALAKAIK